MAARLYPSLLVILLALAVGQARNLNDQRGVRTGPGNKDFIVIGDSEYYVDTNSWLNFDDAKADCENRGSRLVSFSSQEKYDELMAWIHANGHRWQWFWTGGQREANSQEWKWQGLDEPITYFYWASGRPSDNDMSKPRCITISYDFNGWDDDMCSQVVYPHICEKC